MPVLCRMHEGRAPLGIGELDGGACLKKKFEHLDTSVERTQHERGAATLVGRIDLCSCKE